jgi:hypothetical protein
VLLERSRLAGRDRRDGLITFFGFYRREEDALEALGLGSERDPG